MSALAPHVQQQETTWLPRAPFRADSASRMTDRSIVVMGLGNVLMGDDALGPTVVQRLAAYEVEPNAQLLDPGTRGFDRVARVSAADALVVVDTVRVAGAPGEVRQYGKEQLLAKAMPQRVAAHDPGLKDTLLTLELHGVGARGRAAGRRHHGESGNVRRPDAGRASGGTSGAAIGACGVGEAGRAGAPPPGTVAGDALVGVASGVRGPSTSRGLRRVQAHGVEHAAMELRWHALEVPWVAQPIVAVAAEAHARRVPQRRQLRRYPPG